MALPIFVPHHFGNISGGIKNNIMKRIEAPIRNIKTYLFEIQFFKSNINTYLKIVDIK